MAATTPITSTDATEPKKMKFHASTNLQNAQIFESRKCTRKEECDCINELCPNFSSRVECPAKCRTTCKNQFFRNPSTLPTVQARTSPISGRGLHAMMDILQGMLIIFYVGEVVSTAEREVRRKKYDREKRVNYFYETSLRDTDITIDPTIYGNIAKYANHSCDPNMVARTWTYDRCPQGFRIIVFIADRFIRSGTELTFDYGRSYDRLPCYCQSVLCSKWISEQLSYAESQRRLAQLEINKPAVQGPAAPKAPRQRPTSEWRNRNQDVVEVEDVENVAPDSESYDEMEDSAGPVRGRSTRFQAGRAPGSARQLANRQTDVEPESDDDMAGPSSRRDSMEDPPRRSRALRSSGRIKEEPKSDSEDEMDENLPGPSSRRDEMEDPPRRRLALRSSGRIKEEPKSDSEDERAGPSSRRDEMEDPPRRRSTLRSSTRIKEEPKSDSEDEMADDLPGPSHRNVRRRRSTQVLVEEEDLDAPGPSNRIARTLRSGRVLATTSSEALRTPRTPRRRVASPEVDFGDLDLDLPDFDAPEFDMDQDVPDANENPDDDVAEDPEPSPIHPRPQRDRRLPARYRVSDGPIAQAAQVLAPAPRAGGAVVQVEEEGRPERKKRMPKRYLD